MSSSVQDKLTSGRLLARNAIYNLAGQGAPLLVALVAMPFLVRGLGTERFGVLSLAWMIVGYLSLFDLGLGQALTQLVAERAGSGREREIPESVWTGMALMGMLGLAGAVAGLALSPWLVHDALNIPAALQPETLSSFRLLSASIPFVICTAAFQGILAAYQRFGIINALRIPMGVFTFLGPLIVLPFSRSVFAIVAVLTAGRVAACLAHLIICLSAVPALRQGFTLQPGAVAPLLRFGGWTTISNIIGPLMTYMDRFLIGALLSVTAVAYYTTPYDVVSRLGIIPVSLTGVLFPAFSASFAQDPDRTSRLFGRGVKYIFLAMFPVTLLLVAFSHEGLSLWLGAEFARESARVLQWITLGTLVNGLAMVPFALVRGAGRPHLTARLHFGEALFYIPALWLAVGRYGIEGAAFVWFVRVALDAVFLFAFARKLLPAVPASTRSTTFVICAAFGVLGLVLMQTGLVMKGITALTALLLFVITAWFVVLDQGERDYVRGFLTQV